MSWDVAMFWILAGLVAAQAVATIPFLRAIRRTRGKNMAATPCPKAAVILCLRGSDPFLPRCLDAILHQDYPPYDVHIVIDSPDDPAWKTVEQITVGRQLSHNLKSQISNPASEEPAGGAANVHVRALTTRRETCSLKCSSLVQAISGLDASCEAVALLDADTVPHRTWLRELVAPLADGRVAAATGNRWYMPPSTSWGSLVRRLWNAAAVVLMYLFRIPWGGTLVLKMSVIRQGNLLDRWARAFCEDTMLYTALRRLGYRIAFVPSLMMVNGEACSVSSFCRWARRQLLNVRLYHPGWVMILGHGLVVSAAQLVAIVLLAAALIAGHGYVALWLGAGVALYWVTMAALLVVLETGVRRISTGETPGREFRVSRLFSPRAAAAMLLTQVMYPAILLSAVFLRNVDWRGIRYRIRSPDNIRMVKYRPCARSHDSDEILQSL